MKLVIAEKPSVAQSIAAALGVKDKKDGYMEGGGCLISWCVGHLVQLAEAAAYGDLGFIPPAKSAFYCVTHNQNCTYEKTGCGGYLIAAASRLFYNSFSSVCHSPP